MAASAAQRRHYQAVTRRVLVILRRDHADLYRSLLAQAKAELEN